MQRSPLACHGSKAAIDGLNMVSKPSVIGFLWQLRVSSSTFVCKDLSVKVVFASSAEVVWTDIDEDFNKVDGSRIFSLHLPTVNPTYSMLVQEESQRLHAPRPVVLDPTLVYSAAMTHKKWFNGVCDDCKIEGQKRESCYKLIGYPSDFKFTRKKDLSSGKILGIGKEQGALYVLQPSQPTFLSSSTLTKGNISFHTTATTDLSLLWHSRLGHASISRLSRMPLQPCNFSDSTPIPHCYICPLSKQTRLPFTISKTRVEIVILFLELDTSFSFSPNNLPLPLDSSPLPLDSPSPHSSSVPPVSLSSKSPIMSMTPTLMLRCTFRLPK
ncbi:hypothetical protein PVK06_047784 [Gossypium arboreum]|uniref:GAG-pre-integrase domain-containing protein n=1 Tax=Gossypium arboreum TaxID=29729 RepID=A0ABR0MEH6_GOSAR|nr:hypothetical protein PVK06_047784 [Gossypium arboreum]